MPAAAVCTTAGVGQETEMKVSNTPVRVKAGTSKVEISAALMNTLLDSLEEFP
jgi:hypothetical protein